MDWPCSWRRRSGRTGSASSRQTPVPSTTDPGAASSRLSGAIGKVRRAYGSTNGGKSARMRRCSIISKKLPANVYKVEADRQMIALYWGEKGEASVLQDITDVLKALA